MPASVRCATLQPCPGFSGDGRRVSSCGGCRFAPVPASARTSMRQIVLLLPSLHCWCSPPRPRWPRASRTRAKRMCPQHRQCRRHRRQPPTRPSSLRPPPLTSAASGAPARPSPVAMHTQRDVTASRGSTDVAGAMCGFIVRTIAMDIATMNTSGANSAAILQAPATAVAGAGCIGSITVGICEGWDRGPDQGSAVFLLGQES